MTQSRNTQATSSVGIATLMEAIRLEKEGRYDEAWARCRAVLTVNPRHPDALHLSGMIAMRQGRLDEAADMLRKAVKAEPKLLEAHVNLAHVYALSGAWRQRAESLKAALSLQPSRADIMTSIGQCHEKLGRWPEAAEWFVKGLAAGADPAATRIDLGTAKMRQGRLAEAEAEYAAVLRTDPTNPMALANLAVLRDRQGDMDAVLPLLDRAIAAHAEHVDLHYHRALALLTRGRLSEGWAEYAWRFKRDAAQTRHGTFPMPYWQGEALAGKHLLIWTEQGPGDELLLGTMIPEVLAQAEHCTLICTPRLVPLFRRAFPAMTVITSGDTLGAQGPLPDVQASLSHLGQWLRPSFDSFPASSNYLKANPERVQVLRQRYSKGAPDRRLIGISWRSANVNASAEKSTSLRDWESLLRTPGAQFVSLQYGDVRADLKQAASASGISIVHDTEIDPLTDMDAFAAQVAAMDDVISVSNTTVHVAGALGKPVTVLVPASYGRIWYWFLDRADSPWYPTARLYRQGRDTPWSEVVARATAGLNARTPPKP